jgi:hypothetical protein
MNWQEINQTTHSRNVYLYGRSEDWVHKAIVRLSTQPKCIIDRDTCYHGTEYLGLKVVPIEEVDHDPDAFFVITAADYGGIVEALEDRGYRKSINYAISPDFSSYEVLCTMRDHQARLLLSCSDYNDQRRARSSKRGGGIYILNTQSLELEKVITGSFRQVIKADDKYIAVDYVEKLIVAFDNKFSITMTANLDLPNFCGIGKDEQTGCIFLANAGVDIICIHDSSSLKKIGEVKIRPPISLKNSSHHLNDFYICDGIIYFTYFSRLGQWKQGIFDGGLSAISCASLIDKHEMTLPEPLIGNLWKPHSPYILNNEIYALDSMRGYLMKGSNERLAKFPGFIRGLDHDGRYFYVGLSEDMYVVERGDPHGCMLNAGVFAFDSENHAFRFFPANGIMNIHSIKVLDSGECF